jgi:hypothetical protein
MAVDVNLQAERCPGEHADIAQAEDVVDEVEIVVQAFA